MNLSSHSHAKQALPLCPANFRNCFLKRKSFLDTSSLPSVAQSRSAALSYPQGQPDERPPPTSPRLFRIATARPALLGPRLFRPSRAHGLALRFQRRSQWLDVQASLPRADVCRIRFFGRRRVLRPPPNCREISRPPQPPQQILLAGSRTLRRYLPLHHYPIRLVRLRHPLRPSLWSQPSPQRQSPRRPFRFHLHAQRDHRLCPPHRPLDVPPHPPLLPPTP